MIECICKYIYINSINYLCIYIYKFQKNSRLICKNNKIEKEKNIKQIKLFFLVE